jgi:dolichol-phosphate mannosyltransferase
MVMIPTYNERENIGPLIETILALPYEIEIVVVDDDSPDGTGEIVDHMASLHSALHVIHRVGEKGRGSAGIAGFRYAIAHGADFIMEMDADFSHDPRYIPDFLREAPHYDVVIGSRYIPGGGAIGSPWPLRLQSRLANLAVRLILGLKVHDASGGFKGYRRHVLETLPFDNFVSSGWSIGAETLFHIARQRFSYKEIPYVFVNRRQGRSKSRPLEGLNYFKTLWLIRRRYGPLPG